MSLKTGTITVESMLDFLPDVIWTLDTDTGAVSINNTRVASIGIATIGTPPQTIYGVRTSDGHLDDNTHSTAEKAAARAAIRAILDAIDTPPERH